MDRLPVVVVVAVVVVAVVVVVVVVVAVVVVAVVVEVVVAVVVVAVVVEVAIAIVVVVAVVAVVAVDVVGVVEVGLLSAVAVRLRAPQTVNVVNAVSAATTARTCRGERRGLGRGPIALGFAPAMTSHDSGVSSNWARAKISSPIERRFLQRTNVLLSFLLTPLFFVTPFPVGFPVPNHFHPKARDRVLHASTATTQKRNRSPKHGTYKGTGNGPRPD